MLRHEAYFETLASIRDQDSPEWRVTLAGLAVLRLVDDWLAFGARVLEVDRRGLTIARELLAQIAEHQQLAGPLGHTLASIERSEKIEPLTVAEPILSYTRNLSQRGQFGLAKSALLPIGDRAKMSKDSKTVMDISFELGMVSRRLGQLDEASEHYNIAAYHARQLGNQSAQLFARLAASKIFALQGDFSRADAMIATVVNAAFRIGNQPLAGAALHDRGFFASLYGNHSQSVLFFRQALPLAANQTPILADLASGLGEIGRWDQARLINHRIVITAADCVNRWQAMTNLMYAEAVTGTRSNFDLYYRATDLADMDPWSRYGFHQTASLGYSLFGDQMAAKEQYERASSIAAECNFRVGFVQSVDLSTN